MDSDLLDYGDYEYGYDYDYDSQFENVYSPEDNIQYKLMKKTNEAEKERESEQESHISINNNQEYEEISYQQELNNAFIQDDDTLLLNEEDINNSLSRSQLIAKITQQSKLIAKQERKIQKLKKHVKEYRTLCKNQVGLFETVCNYIEHERDCETKSDNENKTNMKTKND